MLEILKQPFQ